MAQGTEVGSVFVSLGLDLSELRRGVTQAANQLDSMGQQFQSVGQSLVKGVTGPLAAAGGASVRFASQMEESLSQAQAQAGLTDEAMQQIADGAEQVATETGQSFEKVVESYKFARSAGLDLAESQEIVETAAKAAASGFGEQTTLLRGMTTVMAGFGDEAGSATEIMDQMVATAQNLEVQVPALTEVMGQVVQVADEVEIGFSEMLAAVGSVGEQFGDVRKAGNLMATSLSQLLDPSQQIRKRLEAIGTSAEQLKANIEQNGITAAMTRLRKRAEEAGVEFASLVQGARSARVMLALTSDEGSRVAEVMDEASGSAGALNEAFKQSESFSRLLSKSFESLRTSLQPVGALLIESIAPALETATQKMQELSDQFTALPEGTQKTILALGGVAAAAGPVLVGLGTLISLAGTATGALASISTPILATGGVVAALGAGAAASEDFRDTLVDSVRSAVDAALGFWDTFGDEITTGASILSTTVIETFEGLSDSLLRVVSSLLKTMQGDFEGAYNDIIEATKTWRDSLVTIFEEIEELRPDLPEAPEMGINLSVEGEDASLLQKFFRGTFTFPEGQVITPEFQAPSTEPLEEGARRVQELFRAAFQNAGDAGQRFINRFGGDVEAMLKNLGDFSVEGSILGVIQDLTPSLQAAGDAGREAMDKVGQNADQAKSRVQDLSGVVKTFRDRLQEFRRATREVEEGGSAEAAGMGDVISRNIPDQIQTPFSAEEVRNARNQLKQMRQQFLQNIRATQRFKQIGRQAMQGVARGIGDMVGRLATGKSQIRSFGDVMESVFQSIISKITQMIAKMLVFKALSAAAGGPLAQGLSIFSSAGGGGVPVPSSSIGQEGGFVEKGGFARIHEGESVVTADAVEALQEKIGSLGEVGEEDSPVPAPPDVTLEAPSVPPPQVTLSEPSDSLGGLAEQVSSALPEMSMPSPAVPEFPESFSAPTGFFSELRDSITTALPEMSVPSPNVSLPDIPSVEVPMPDGGEARRMPAASSAPDSKRQPTRTAQLTGGNVIIPGELIDQAAQAGSRRRGRTGR